LLYTGQRRSDVVKMSWRDIDGDIIRVTQKKTNTKLEIPLHPDLKSLLADWPKRHVLILATTFGKPFAATGLVTGWPTRLRLQGYPTSA
jgi:integrase